MKTVEGKYASALVYSDSVEDYALAQIKLLSDDMSFKGSRIRVMPDVHPGKVGPVGFTATVTERILPSVVGVDIGCGMSAVKIKEKRVDCAQLDKLVHRRIPAGLIEEIRALAVPPIPWDVELGKWFDVHFSPLEARHTYARPSRRQGASPDIPRPRYVPADIPEYSRTYGVAVDTSGSMSAKTIGYALGAIASYSEAKEVPYARVVFCDADAYDAGYISPGDIAGRVEVKGRGGTVLQPAVDLLQHADDFPKDAPILLITDGMIEDSLNVKREHAYLLPRGNRLPFRAKGQVFYFEQKQVRDGK